MLTVSLNEVETMGAKAARGAGAGWGMAEDVGRACRWLAQRGFDWSPALLRLLESGGVVAHLRPAFHAADLLAGQRAGDRLKAEGCPPLWMLPILSAALLGRGLTVDVGWPGCTARLSSDGGLSTAAPLQPGDASRPQAITIAILAPVPPFPCALPASSRRGTVSPATWAAFEHMAARTYVPASTRSRAGAGGGGVDAE